jgi:hypothetical protein
MTKSQEYKHDASRLEPFYTHPQDTSDDVNKSANPPPSPLIELHGASGGIPRHSISSSSTPSLTPTSTVNIVQDSVKAEEYSNTDEDAIIRRHEYEYEDVRRPDSVELSDSDQDDSFRSRVGSIESLPKRDGVLEHIRDPEPPGVSGHVKEPELSEVAASTVLLGSTEILESTRSPESTKPTEFSAKDRAKEVTNLHNAPTEYSASNLTDLPPVHEAYVSEFAQNVFQRLQSDGLAIEDLERISGVVADNLKGFATRLGIDAEAQIPRDIVYFTYKRRRQACLHPILFDPANVIRNIQDAFERILHDERKKDEHISWRSRVNDWFKSEGQLPSDKEPWDNPPDFEVPDPPSSTSTVGEGSISCSESDIPEMKDNELGFQKYKDTIHNSSAYRWLLGTLRREAILQPADQDQMREIRAHVLRSFTDPERISRSVSPNTQRATIILQWDPWEFVKDRDPQQLPETALLGAITLTGSPLNAQAMMCSDYLTQTWPTTGKDVALMLANIMRGTPGTQRCGESCQILLHNFQKWTSDRRGLIGSMTDGTALTATFDGQRTVIGVVGVADSIAEVAQQLAWTGAALQCAPANVGQGLYSCSSNITSTAWKLNEHGSELIIDMDFKMEKLTIGSNGLGDCWHKMLRTPVLVKGFPILAKSIEESGIEMPLDIMACLTGSHRVIEFDEKVVLKGFSTMLTAVKRTEGFLIWHYTFHADKSRIPFFEAASPENDNIHLGLLESSRHIIGWCSSARYHTGKPSTHSLNHSRLTMLIHHVSR